MVRFYCKPCLAYDYQHGLEPERFFPDLDSLFEHGLRVHPDFYALESLQRANDKIEEVEDDAGIQESN